MKGINIFFHFFHEKKGNLKVLSYINNRGTYFFIKGRRFMKYYEEIKEILINNEITKRVKDYSKNKSDLDSYFKVGKLLIEAQGGEARAKYGDNIIKEYSKKLTSELGKGYTVSALKRMR